VSRSGSWQSSGSPQAIRADLAQHLRARRPEIELAITTKIGELPIPVEEDDVAYAAGLTHAVEAGVAYALEGIAQGREWSAPAPPAAVDQVHRAARVGVDLDIILRQCFLGGKVLDEFVLAEAEGIPSQLLREILGDQGALIDRLIELVVTEYEGEVKRLRKTTAQRQAEQVVALLRGNGPLTPIDIDYDFSAWHVGTILRGRSPDLAARSLAQESGCRSLHVIRDRETAWVWFSSARHHSLKRWDALLATNTPPQISVAVGEPREGLDGWRLTHREAEVALRVMLRKPERLTRGRDVILLSGIMRDETLVRSLLDAYLLPLTNAGDPTKTLLQTLRAYFTSAGNAVAAAALLGVTRHTVQRRIRAVEETLGQPIHTCQAELQVALQIEELNEPDDGARD
jgi:hypothetical protein